MNVNKLFDELARSQTDETNDTSAVSSSDLQAFEKRLAKQVATIREEITKQIDERLSKTQAKTTTVSASTKTETNAETETENEKTEE